jgi:hypothetical protein
LDINEISLKQEIIVDSPIKDNFLGDNLIESKTLLYDELPFVHLEGFIVVLSKPFSDLYNLISRPNGSLSDFITSCSID